MNTRNRIIGIVLVVIVAMFLFWRGQVKTSDDQLSDPLKNGSIVESVYGIGTVVANRTFEFRPGVTNTIFDLFVKEGDAVKKGDQLLKLENEYIISAPFDGTVTALPLEIGENVFPQTLVIEIVDLLDRYLVVSLEQRGALSVRKGQIAKLSFDGFRDQTFVGVVDSVYSSGNDFLIRVNISNLPAEILPGMTADAAIGINEHKDVLLIPVAAINNGEVFVKDGGRAKKVAIKTGIIDAEMAEVVSADLKEGDRLLIRKKVR